MLGGALNLTPIFEVLGWALIVGFALFVLFWVGFFLLAVVGSATNYLRGDKNDEFGAIIVFYGGLAIVIALIVLAFTHGIIAFE